MAADPNGRVRTTGLIPKQRQIASGSLQNAPLMRRFCCRFFCSGAAPFRYRRRTRRQSGPDPAYNKLVAKHIKDTFKDYASYDAFEISEYRWVHSIKGWSWLTCVRFQDKGRRLTYALFIKQKEIIDISLRCGDRRLRHADLFTLCTSWAVRKASTLAAYWIRCIRTPCMTRADPICSIGWPVHSASCRQPHTYPGRVQAVTRLLVTGASGFLGRAAIAAFAQNGCALRAAVRRQPEPAFPSGVEVAQHPDLSEAFDWRPLLDGSRSGCPSCRDCSRRPRRVTRALRSHQSAGDSKACGCVRTKQASGISYSSLRSAPRADPPRTMR